MRQRFVPGAPLNEREKVTADERALDDLSLIDQTATWPVIARTRTPQGVIEERVGPQGEVSRLLKREDNREAALRMIGYSAHTGRPRLGPKAQIARWGLGEDELPATLDT